MPSASELHVRLAQLDSMLARLQDTPGGRSVGGVQAVRSMLRRMSSVADRRGKPAQAELRRFIGEREEQLRRIARESEPLGQVIDQLLGGGDGRIQADRGGARLDRDVRDLQDVDVAAGETWVGSGEAAKVFPEVFGALIPAEGARVVHERGPDEGKKVAGEALRSEHTYGRPPSMETLNLRKPEPGFRIAADGEGMGASSGIHTARRNRSRGHEVGAKDALPDGEEFLELISGRVYELLMEELEQAFESR